MSQTLHEGILDRRRAGILLHITSLPGPAQCGDLGADAYRFVDFIHKTGFTVWQILPVGPTQTDGSPYQSSSIHAGNPRLINVGALADQTLLPSEFALNVQITDADKKQLLIRAWNKFQSSPQQAMLRSTITLSQRTDAGWITTRSIALYGRRT